MIKIGIIGSGYWGPNLLRNFVDIPQSQVVIAADLKRDRLNQIGRTYPSIKLTTDYHEFFKEAVDAVVIATPPSTHHPIARECLAHGLHVMVEKPLTLNSAHAEELIELAQKNDLILMVGHTFEYNAAVHAMKQLMDSGELGEIYYLEFGTP